MEPALNDIQLATLLTKQKADVFRFFYTRGWVTLCVDASSSAVDVPVHLKSESNLRIRLGANLPLPTTSVRVGNAGVKATLFFNGRPYPCNFPWADVLAIIGQEDVGILWAGTKVLLLRKRNPKPRLDVLSGGRETSDEDSENAAQERRSAFRVVKDSAWKSN